jgi:hypothetical protein
VRAAGGVLDAIDELALDVGLDGLDLDAELGRERAQAVVDLLERERPVDVGLATTEEVQVRAVQHEHGLTAGAPILH